MHNKVFLFEITNLLIQFEYYVRKLSPCKYGILISLSVHRFLKYNLLAHTYILHSEKKKSNREKVSNGQIKTRNFERFIATTKKYICTVLVGVVARQ